MGGIPGGPQSPGPPYREKREVPRFSLIADVALTEPATGTRISGRISEISRKGCYIDVLNPLPVGSSINLKVSRDQGEFTTNGKIIYVQPGMGMGVAFVDVSPAQLNTLDAWLKELSS